MLCKMEAKMEAKMGAKWGQKESILGQKQPKGPL